MDDDDARTSIDSSATVTVMSREGRKRSAIGHEGKVDAWREVWRRMQRRIAQTLEQVHVLLYDELTIWLRHSRSCALGVADMTAASELDAAVLVTGINTVDSLIVIQGLKARFRAEEGVHVATLRPTCTTLESAIASICSQLLHNDETQSTANEPATTADTPWRPTRSKRAYGMPALLQWYKEHALGREPAASARPALPPRVTIIVSESEAYAPHLLDDLVLTVAGCSAEVRVSLVFCVGTSGDVMQKIVSRSAMARLRLTTYSLRSSKDIIDDIVHAVLLDCSSPLVLGPKMLDALYDNFLDASFTVERFMLNLKAAHIQHYSKYKDVHLLCRPSFFFSATTTDEHTAASIHRTLVHEVDTMDADAVDLLSTIPSVGVFLSMHAAARPSSARASEAVQAQPASTRAGPKLSPEDLRALLRVMVPDWVLRWLDFKNLFNRLVVSLKAGKLRPPSQVSDRLYHQECVHALFKQRSRPTKHMPPSPSNGRKRRAESETVPERVGRTRGAATADDAADRGVLDAALKELRACGVAEAQQIVREWSSAWAPDGMLLSTEGHTMCSAMAEEVRQLSQSLQDACDEHDAEKPPCADGGGAEPKPSSPPPLPAHDVLAAGPRRRRLVEAVRMASAGSAEMHGWCAQAEGWVLRCFDALAKRLSAPLHELFITNDRLQTSRANREEVFNTLMDGVVTRGSAELGLAGKTAATPDTPLLYQLSIEDGGRYINTAEWFERFSSTAKRLKHKRVRAGPNNGARGSKDERLAEMQARFLSSVSDLEQLGIMHRKKSQPHHVERVAFGTST